MTGTADARQLLCLAECMPRILGMDQFQVFLGSFGLHGYHISTLRVRKYLRQYIYSVYILYEKITPKKVWVFDSHVTHTAQSARQYFGEQ
jgi:hypothetical protein